VLLTIAVLEAGCRIAQKPTTQLVTASIRSSS